MKKVALYARVSLDETNENDRHYQEPENQLMPLREFCKTMEYEITSEYVDRASGANPNRPRFRQMMQDGMMHKFNHILVWKLDRFSREKLTNTVAYIQQLKSRNVALISLTESWLNTSIDNPTSDLILAIMAWAAAEERRKISERTKVGIQRLKNIGQWKGGRPKKQITLENEKEINELLQKGKNITTIANRLKISKNTIKKFLEKGSPIISG